MAFVDLFKPKHGASGFGSRSTAEEVTAGIDLTGKNILITGVNSGLGAETARVLVLRGARVLGTARTVEKAQQACAGWNRDVAVVPLACELTDISSIEECVDAVKKLGSTLDVIICNAGIMCPPKLGQCYGVERQFFTNHVSHFFLVTRLLEHLAENGRVVMVSSYAHKMSHRCGIDFENLSGEKGYRPLAFYGQSKLANILFARELTKRFAGSNRTANAIHPGTVATNLGRDMGIVDTLWKITAPIYTKHVAQGAATQCYVATNPALRSVSGKYFADCNEKKPSRHAGDDAMSERLWDVTEGIVNVAMAARSSNH